MFRTIAATVVMMVLASASLAANNASVESNTACTKCSKDIQTGGKFCPECGAPVTTGKAASFAQDKSAGEAKSAAELRFNRVDLLDNNDGQKAFTMLVPENWKARANITYVMDRPTAPADIAIRAVSANGKEEFNLVPSIAATWSPTIAACGLQRNLGYEVMQCPDKATNFLYQLVLPRLRRGLKEVRVLEVQSYDKAARALAAEAPQPPNGELKVQMARIRVEYKDPKTGVLVNEDITGTLYHVTCWNMRGDGQREAMNTWLMDNIHATRAPAGELGRSADLFACMAASVRPDMEWMKRYVRAMNILIDGEAGRQKEVMKRFEIITRNGHEIADIIHSTYANHTNAVDRAMDQWSQAIRGTQKYNSPHENYPVELPGGYKYAWTSGNGQYILTNNALFNPNEGSTQKWNLMDEKR